MDDVVPTSLPIRISVGVFSTGGNFVGDSLTNSQHSRRVQGEASHVRVTVCGIYGRTKMSGANPGKRILAEWYHAGRRSALCPWTSGKLPAERKFLPRQCRALSTASLLSIRYLLSVCGR